MKNIWNEFRTTLIGIGLIIAALYYNLSDTLLIIFIIIAIVLMFAKDEIPMIIKKLANKFLGK